MPAPTAIPPGVQAAVDGMVARLARVASKHRAKLMDITSRLIVDLEAKMLRLAGSASRFETTATAAKLIQLQALSERLGVQYGTNMGAAVTQIGRRAAAIGRDQLVKQIEAWAAVHPAALSQLIPPDLASDLLDEGLLEHYAVSRRLYGMEAIGVMRMEVAQGILNNGESLAKTWRRIAEKLSLPDWRAERIVRTEHSLAANRRQLLDMEEVYGEPDEAGDVRVGGWWKGLVTTFDDRTGHDSVFVSGQRRRLHEPFEDNLGNSYQTPPNRPNDREVVVFVPEL